MTTPIVDDPTTWRLRTTGGIPYRLKSQNAVFEYNKSVAVEVYIMQTSRAFDFARESYPPPFTTINKIPIVIPRAMPGFPTLFTRRISLKPHDDGRPIDLAQVDLLSPENTYGDLCELTIEYDNTFREPDPTNTDTFLRVSARGSGEYIHFTAPKGKWQTQDPETFDKDTLEGVQLYLAAQERNRYPDLPTTKRIPKVDWTFEWPHIDAGYWKDTMIPRLRDNIGKVNDSPMERFANAPAETILFDGWDVQEEFILDPVTALPFTVSLHFVEKNAYDRGAIVTHNHFWKPDEGRWKRLLIDGENPAYEATDLEVLFRPTDPEEDE